MALAAAVPTRCPSEVMSRSPERASGGGRDRLPLPWGEGADRYHRQARAWSREILRGGPAARTAAAAPGRAAHGRPGGRRAVRRRRAWGGSGLRRRRLRSGLGLGLGLGLRLRLFRRALLRHDALFLTGWRGVFPRLPFLRFRLRS